MQCIAFLWYFYIVLDFALRVTIEEHLKFLDAHPLNFSANRLAMKMFVSRNLSTQFTRQVSVFPSSLLPGLSTHFSQHMSVKAWIWLWNLCFWSSAISSSWSFRSIWELFDAPPNDILLLTFSGNCSQCKKYSTCINQNGGSYVALAW